MTFVLTSALFVGLALLVALVLRPPVSWRAAALAALAMAALTAVFDNLMIAADLFDYGHDQLLGIYLGRAPIEDFTYPLAALVLLPALWHRLRGTGPAGPRSAETLEHHGHEDER